jgi:hypothetical protein
MDISNDAAPVEFKYDVAISFQGKDEALATELVDLLQDRFNTFIYLKKQDELAGRDGEELFGEVFQFQARVVIVLCRPEWGQTPFTRIEEIAIRNRAFSEGYDFTLFVPTTNPAAIPKWLPKARLHYGLERFGIKGIAAVVVRLIEEQGGSPRVESIADRAARFERASNFQREKERFGKSYDGAQSFQDESDTLLVELAKKFTVLKGQTPSLRELQIFSERGPFIAAGMFPVLIVLKKAPFTNSLDGAEINVKFYDDFPDLQGYMGAGHANVLRELHFSYGLIRPGVSAFILQDDTYSVETLTDYIIRIYFDIAEKQNSRI